jgi:GMP synthase (glutamine-hydrolysing)
MKRVLAVQQIWDDPPGYLGELLQLHGIDYQIVQADREPLPPHLQGYDALLVLGGPQHAAAEERYPYLVQEKLLIRQAVAEDIPYLGICLGGQLLAHALGAAVHPHHTIELGFYQVELTEEGRQDPLFRGLPGYQQVVHWHEDVFELPPGARLLATAPGTPHQAFRYGRRAYGLQYHIELTPEMLDTWFLTPGYREEVIKVLGPDAIERLEQQRRQYYPLYRQHTRTVFENFLRLADLLDSSEP